MDEIKDGDEQVGSIVEFFINGVPQGKYEINELEKIKQ